MADELPAGVLSACSFELYLVLLFRNIAWCSSFRFLRLLYFSARIFHTTNYSIVMRKP